MSVRLNRNITSRLLLAIMLCSMVACGERGSFDKSASGPGYEDAKLPNIEVSDQMRVFRTRVMTYNVHNCRGTDGVVDYKRVADVISKRNLDVVALQELDSMTSRCPRDVLKILSDLTGMHHVFGAAINHSGGKYGVGVLTKEEPISHYRIPLPCSSEPRVVLVVEMKDYYLFCTHFSLLAEYRERAVDIIVAEAEKLNKPVILAGDLNATRDQISIQTLAEHFHIYKKLSLPNTFPSSSPTKEIDYICLYKNRGAGAEFSEHAVLNIPVISDHCPVIADMIVCE